MGTLFEEAKAFEPQQTMNIADLDSVPVRDVQLFTKEGKNAEGEAYSFRYLEFNGKPYRVPTSVVEELQTIIKLKPDVKNIRVKKSGSGLATRYKVEVIN